MRELARYKAVGIEVRLPCHLLRIDQMKRRFAAELNAKKLLQVGPGILEK
jgi:hypothetical protein